MTLVELSVGLVLLLAGGEALVKGSVAVAQRLGVSPLVIGLTLVGFGTSTPELVASLDAALTGAPGIAIGNVVGSNIANVLLILGIGGTLLPMTTTKDAFRRDGTVLVACSLLMLAVVLYGSMDRWIGVGFLLLLAAYTIHTYLAERRTPDAAAGVYAAEGESVAEPGMSLPLGAVIAAGGIAAVVFGADLLVGAAVVIARDLGVSEAVIGLTLVAVGTSLPELATSIMAALRRQPDVAFGNVVGSNIFNVLGIAGTTAAVTPIPVPPEIGHFDIWVMVGVALLLVVFAATVGRVGRREGIIFLSCYGAYMVVQFVPAVRQAIGLV